MMADALAHSGVQVRVLCGAEGPMLGVYEEHGHEVEVVRHKNWLRDSHQARSLRNIAREWWNAEWMAERIGAAGADLVYVNTAASYAGALAAKRLGIPCIWHLRELFSDAGGELVVPRGLRWWVRREFRRLGSKIVVNSEAVAANLLGPEAAAAQVVPNAISDRFFSPAGGVKFRAKHGLAASERLIGIPGTLRLLKGHRFALEGLRPVLEQNPDVRVVISGGASDDYGKALVKEFSEDFWRQRIVWAGVVEDMLRFYSACDMVLVPSSSESFGRTVIEAMACGLPVVATRVGGIPEIIDYQENGLMIEYGDDYGLAQEVSRLLADKELRQRLGKAAREKAASKYSEAVHAQRILEVVNETMAKR
jgi:glycosyltransferase involved in cell wall biosynthesis